MHNVIVGFVSLLRHLVGGVVVGAMCGAVIGIAGLLLLRDIQSFADPGSWLLLAASIVAVWGGVAGAVGVVVLTARARVVTTFRRLAIDGTVLGATGGLGIFAIGSVQAGDLGPERILALAIVGGAVTGFLLAISMRVAIRK